MSGNFTDYRAHKWLAELPTMWAGLHYSDPNISGAYASEVFGGSYSRVKATFSTPVNRVTFNSADVLFRGLPTVKITFIGLWDAQYNGNLEAAIPLIEPVTVYGGGSFKINVETLALSLP